jgi:hypothetical protein
MNLRQTAGKSVGISHQSFSWLLSTQRRGWTDQGYHRQRRENSIVFY